jgi:hypothetical protein
LNKNPATEKKIGKRDGWSDRKLIFPMDPPTGIDEDKKTETQFDQ